MSDDLAIASVIDDILKYEVSLIITKINGIYFVSVKWDSDEVQTDDESLFEALIQAKDKIENYAP